MPDASVNSELETSVKNKREVAKKYPRGDRPSPGAFVSTDNQYLDASVQGNSRALSAFGETSLASGCDDSLEEQHLKFAGAKKVPPGRSSFPRGVCIDR
jgi:hypothetical protein